MKQNQIQAKRIAPQWDKEGQEGITGPPTLFSQEPKNLKTS